MIRDSVETFRLAGRRVIRFAVLYAALAVIVNVLAYAGLAAFRSGAADPTEVSTQASVLLVAIVGGFLALVSIVGMLISGIVWLVSAHQVRPGGPGLVGYGSLVLSISLVISAYVVPERLTSTVDARGVVDAAMRIGSVVILILGVIVVRTRVGRDTGRPDLADRPSVVTKDDWNSEWDPDVIRDVERRRRNERD